jgi:hypothetical protein
MQKRKAGRACLAQPKGGEVQQPDDQPGLMHNTAKLHLFAHCVQSV